MLLPPPPLPPSPLPSLSLPPVTFHNERRVTLEIEVDALDTGIPHLKARCLLSLVPGLATLPASAAGSLLPPPPSPSPSSSNSNSAGQAARLGNSTGSNSSGGKDELALVGLVKRVRLEYSKSGYALEEAAEGASLKTARVSDGACLVLEWGVPPETGKARVKFSVRVGEWRFGGFSRGQRREGRRGGGGRSEGGGGEEEEEGGERGGGQGGYCSVELRQFCGVIWCWRGARRVFASLTGV